MLDMAEIIEVDAIRYRKWAAGATDAEIKEKMEAYRENNPPPKRREKAA